MIEQQYYTSSLKRMDGNSGFGIKAQSPGMSVQISKALEQYARYGKPYQAAESDVTNMPVSLTFYGVEEGIWAITRSCYVGQDFSGRWGNFFAHAIVFSRETLQSLHVAPIQLDSAPFWVQVEMDEATTLPALRALPGVPEVSLEQTQQFLQAVPDRDSRFAEMLQALVGLDDTGRRLILVDAPDNVHHWIAALTCALPPCLRHHLTFSTYQRDPYTINLALVGTRMDGDFRFTTAEYQFQFAVFNFEAGRHSSGITPGRAAILLTDTLMAGDVQMLHSIHDLAQQLILSTPKNLDSIAALAQAQGAHGGMRRADLDMVRDMVPVLSVSTPAAQQVAFVLVRRLCQDVMAAGDHERLTVLLPCYHTLVVQTRSEEALRQDVLRFLRQQIHSGRGLSALRFLAAQSATLPLIGESIQVGMTPQDWIAFCENASPEENVLREMWPQIEPVALQAAAQSDMALWRTLAAWTARYNSPFVLQRLRERAVSTPPVSLPALRMIADVFVAESNGASIESTFVLCLAVLGQGLRGRSGGWQSDVMRCTQVIRAGQRRATFLAPLIETVQNDSDALLFTLCALLDGDSAADGPVASILIETRLFESAALLQKAVPEKRLEGLFEQLWQQTARNGQLAAFVRALLPNMSGGARGQEARGILAEAMREMQGSTRAAYDTFLKEVPEITGYADIYGSFLVGKLSLSPLMILDDSRDLEALRNGLNKVTEAPSGDIPHLPADLTYRLSKAQQGLVQKGPQWNSVSRVVPLDQDLRIDPALYRSYVGHVFELLVQHKVALVTSDAIVETLAVDTCLTEFVEQYREYLLMYKREPHEMCKAVYHTLTGIGRRWNYAPETIPLCASLIKCLRGSEQETLDQQFARTLNHKVASRTWWTACYEQGTKTFLSRLFHRG